jgi:hypothetical protein
MALMVMGIVSVGYGLIGERVPGRVLSISDTKSKSLGSAQRAMSVIVGLCAIALGFLDLYRQYKRA